MRITFVNPDTKKTKKIKLGFNWIIFGFGEIYAIPFFIYRLFIFGIIFLITVLACMYYGKPYYLAFVADPFMIFDINQTMRYYTIQLDIASIINLILLVLGGVYGNRLRARKYLKKGWKIRTNNEKIIAKLKKKWKITDSDITNNI